MNAKTEPNTLAPGMRVQLLDHDGTQYLGATGEIKDISAYPPSPPVALVHLDNGLSVYRELRYLRTITPSDESVMAQVNGSSSVGQLKDDPEPLKLLPVGTQVIIVRNDAEPGCQEVAGTFGMIKRHGPLYGHDDQVEAYNYHVHLTSGADIYVNAADVEPIMIAAELDPASPLALMERLSQLRAQEKRMMTNLGLIRDSQRTTEIRMHSLRTCGDQLAADRKSIVRQCEELEFELARSIALAA